VPGWLFPPLFFAGVAVFLAGGIQYQVARKQRTNFNDQVYIEDSSLGKDQEQPVNHVTILHKLCVEAECPRQPAIAGAGRQLSSS
jgi:hypothetical protein